MAEQRLTVKACGVSFPRSGWLSTHTTAPVNGRVLLEVKGHCGRSRWTEVLLTMPESALGPSQDYWSECTWRSLTKVTTQATRSIPWSPRKA
jgi:hypothetical protein